MSLFARECTVQVGRLVVRDLRVAFQVERSLRPTPNKATITITNLRGDHRGDVETQRAGVALAAGYEGASAVIFSGDVRRASNAYEAPNWNTKIEAEDGGAANRTARVGRSFRPGSRLEDVFRACADAMGLGIGNVPNIVRGATMASGETTFRHGTVLSGSASSELDRLCASAGLTWSIQGGALQLLPIGRALRGQAVRLSSETGLVGSPAKDKNGVVKLRTLLMPDLVPGRTVVVDSRTVTGSYRVDRVTYLGDTHNTDWYCDLEVSTP